MVIISIFKIENQTSDKQMDINLLIQTIVGLVVLLGILVFFLVMPSKKKTQITKKSHRNNSSTVKKTDLETLRQIIRNRVSTKAQLKEALEDVIKYHGSIPKRLGSRVNPQFDGYMEMLIMICRHPNTDKNLILNFDKDLARLNPEYKAEINDSIKRGLDSRSV